MIRELRSWLFGVDPWEPTRLDAYRAFTKAAPYVPPPRVRFIEAVTRQCDCSVCRKARQHPIFPTVRPPLKMRVL